MATRSTEGGCWAARAHWKGGEGAYKVRGHGGKRHGGTDDGTASDMHEICCDSNI